MYLFKKVKRKIVLKTKERQDLLNKLRSFLDTELQEAIDILVDFWKDQQAATTHDELRKIVENRDIDEQLLSLWQRDYSLLVANHMKDWWKKAIVQGAISQPIFATFSKRMGKNSRIFKSVESYIQEHGGELITNITNEQRDTIKGLLTNNVVEGHSTDELARAIRPCIGLNERQAKANIKYYDHVKNSLLENHPRMKVESAEKKAREAAEKYAKKQIRYRAQMIANTELAKAYNYGAEEEAVRAYNKGLLGKFERIWCTAGNENVCSDCDLLNGTKVGSDMIPPIHPFCACVLQYVEVEPPMTYGSPLPRQVEFLEAQNADALSDEVRSRLENEIELIPPQHRSIITSEINSLQIIENGNSRYDRQQGIMYLRGGFERGEAIHEIAHIIETNLRLWEGGTLVSIIKGILGEDNPLFYVIDDIETFVKPIKRLNWDEKLISEYQGRVYEEVGLYNEMYEFNYRSLGEFFSEAYTAYLLSPKLLKKKQPEMYEFIKSLEV